MSVVVFPSNTSGYSASKKRKRMPGTNSKKVREVKQVNWFFARADTLLDRVSFNALSVHVSGTADHSSDMLVYKWYELPFPSPGVGYEQAIGRQIFAKYARFKGYINCSGFNSMPISWRMYLLRTEDTDIPAAVPSGSEDLWDLLFNNWEPRPLGSTPDQRFACARHNFYKSVRNVEATKGMDLKVIGAGTIPRMDTGGHWSGAIVGEAAGTYNGKYSNANPIVADGQYCGYCIPIDIVVKLNDNFVFSKIHYYFAFTCDNMFARTVGVADGSETWYDGTNRAVASFNFFTRLYFYDD